MYRNNYNIYEISRKIFKSKNLIRRVLLINDIKIRKVNGMQGKKHSKETLEKFKNRPTYLRTTHHKELMSNRLKTLHYKPSKKCILNSIKFRKGKTYEEMYGEERAQEVKLKIRENAKHNPHYGSKGKIMSDNTKRKLREKALKRYKNIENHPSWKGGITAEYQKMRNSDKYAEWRTKCFKRDNYTCQITDKPGPNLVVHHIKNFSAYKKERFDSANGITMKRYVHNLFHSLYTKQHNTKEEVEEFKIVIKGEKIWDFKD